MIVAVCLMLMAGLSLFNIVLGGTWTSISDIHSISNTAVINGTASSFAVSGQDWVFSIDPISGAAVWLVVIVSIAALVGIRIFGSGLSEQSVRVAIMAIVYANIWTVLSVGASPLMWSIPVFVGMIYISITIVYTVGVIQKIDGENS
jgi:hypothetical protein